MHDNNAKFTHKRNDRRLSLDKHKRPQNKGQQKRKLDAHEIKLIQAKNDATEMRFDLGSAKVYGQVVGFDKYSVIVKEKKSGLDVTLFKHAIVLFGQSEYVKASQAA